MLYDVSPLIPPAYHEKLETINIQMFTDQVLFPNARLLFNCTRVLEDVTATDMVVSALSQTVSDTTTPDIVEALGYVFPIEDGVASVVIGEPREEILTYIEKMYECLRNMDATAAFSVMTLLSNSTKNIVSENVSAMKIKSNPVMRLTPCSL